MDSVVVVNETHGSNLQSRWWGSPLGCLRPAPDLGIPVVCVAGGPTNLTVTPLLSNAIRDCCPLAANGSNIFATHNYCENACFTHEVAVVSQWKGCVENATIRFLDDMTSRGTPVNLTIGNFSGGRCEYIDYPTLRKAVLKTNDGGRSGPGTWTLALAMCLVLFMVQSA